MTRPSRISALLLPLLLGACDLVVLNPAGDVAMQERNLILVALGLMLLIIVPVMVATVVFARRYSANGGQGTYDPEFDHSTMLELGIWSAPLLIIICLGAVTWTSTHLLDPYRPVDRLKAGRPVAAGVKPLEVQVVSLDWKWLFIYPEQGIATVNELATPVDVPVHFRMTSSTVMNTFAVPTLAGMIYTMPGMETSLNAVLNKPGEYAGWSGHYSGAGFSDMRFPYHGLTAAGFDRWVAQVKASGARLDRGAYRVLERPSEDEPARRFGGVEPGLFDRIAGRCVEPGKPCMADVMRRDRQGGAGNPAVTRPGRGTPPVNDAAPMHGGKPDGALFKAPEDKGPAPHFTEPRRPGAPGNRDPGSDRNRDFTMLTTGDAGHKA